MKIISASILSIALLVGCTESAEHAAPVIDTEAVSKPAVSSTIDTVNLSSHALQQEMNVQIYLPPGYKTSERYPVLYMLYGYGGNESSWFSYLGLNNAADQLIQAGTIKPVIIVSPAYGNSFGVNTKPGQGVNPGGVDEGMYEDYLTKDLIKYVDRHYSTIPSKKGRYIGGASMGGYAALYLAFNHPELYSKVGGHSAALWDYSPADQFTDQRDWLYPNEKLRQQRDPLLLAASKKLAGLKVYLDAGESDQLSEEDQALYRILKTRGVPAEWHTSPGGHELDYWKSQLDNYLKFYVGS
ncbi:esterase [Paenibacillus zeisoli]|uniref:Esterase n=1 Tax=Paenibacillus zeisoli TaxID=2496267 RepID=A0A3S1BCS8_9BACL|nr:alpha/beta hydrolase-fold protein [Paenibacillus zeisoli]RUT36528.1 esterase [Paenibacillus zeisoli]